MLLRDIIFIVKRHLQWSLSQAPEADQHPGFVEIPKDRGDGSIQALLGSVENAWRYRPTNYLTWSLSQAPAKAGSPLPGQAIQGSPEITMFAIIPKYFL